MRTPGDVSARSASAPSSHARWWIAGGIVVLLVILGSLRTLANLYTNSLWFSSEGFSNVWSTLVAVKVGLFAVFGATFFVVLWVNLIICDRVISHAPPPDPEEEIVRRFQHAVRPHAVRIYALVALAVSLVAAATAVGQWTNWILFTHATTFPHADPQFGLNDGFFVFRLPFLQFVFNWTLFSLIVIVLITALVHYLNGGIRMHRAPRMRSAVKAHLCILLAAVALVKAGGYVLSRYALDTSTSGFVEGAGYADVRARLPALDVLVFVALFCAAVLLYSLRRPGWVLPVLAAGVWGVVALVIGEIYPSALQALKVNPAQSTLERPYIARNIQATRQAYGLDDVSVSRLADPTVIPRDTVNADITTLDNIRLWDPSPSVALADFKTKQDISAYYTFHAVETDRYREGGAIRPVVVGARQIDAATLPSKSWVNTHLQFTHGEGLVLAESSEATAKGNPVFSIRDVPPRSAAGFPAVKQPAIYYGVDQPGYVVAHTRQAELDGQMPTGTDVEGHYAGSGGVRLGGFFTRAAFALRFGDLNLLVSNLITPESRIMFVRDVRTMAEKIAPFLSYDSQPYPALIDGHVDWLLDAYTTTAEYPYSENADTQSVPPGSGLPGSYNYVRSSVLVVVNAYSGKTTFYAVDRDPILRAYEGAFPKLFTPGSEMPAALRAHLRYGSNVFAIQAALYGRYHITSPSQFYTAGDAWIVPPTTGVGTPDQSLQIARVLNAQGEVVGASYVPMSPVYQVMSEPGESTQLFTVSDAYVPAGGAGDSSQILRGLVVGLCGPTRFGKLHVYETPPGASKVGPIQADTEIEQTTTVSRNITLLNKEGSTVLLGNILPVLVGSSVLYVRPLYVVSHTVPQPQLKYVIAVLGQQVRMKKTLGATLNALLGTSLRSTGGVLTTTPGGAAAGGPTGQGPGSQSSGRSPTGGSKGGSPGAPQGGATHLSSSPRMAEARTLIATAVHDFALAEADLKSGDLAGYQREIAAARSATTRADVLLGELGSASPETGAGSGSPAEGSGATGPSVGASGTHAGTGGVNAPSASAAGAGAGVGSAAVLPSAVHGASKHATPEANEA